MIKVTCPYAFFFGNTDQHFLPENSLRTLCNVHHQTRQWHLFLKPLITYCPILCFLCFKFCTSLWQFGLRVTIWVFLIKLKLKLKSFHTLWLDEPFFFFLIQKIVVLCFSILYQRASTFSEKLIKFSEKKIIWHFSNDNLLSCSGKVKAIVT